jgi:hypothetical protein
MLKLASNNLWFWVVGGSIDEHEIMVVDEEQVAVCLIGHNYAVRYDAKSLHVLINGFLDLFCDILRNGALLLRFDLGDDC